MILSEAQQNIFNFVKESDQSLVCDATAGSGKTTTLLRAVIPALIEKGHSYGEILTIMYSKPIQIEFESKARKLGISSQISTVHSTGFQLLASKFGTKFDKDKLKKIGEKLGVRKYDVYKLVTFAKTEGVDIIKGRTNSSYWNHLVDNFSLELGYNEIAQAQRVFEISNKDLKTCDYSDMVYLPIQEDLKLPNIKVLLTDEYQDLSLSRIEFIKTVCENVRLIAVGDKNQSIFSFSGSEPSARQKLISNFGAASLPLYTTFRCPKSVVRYCNQIVPEMGARNNAPEGKVEEISLFEFENFDFNSETVILCRLNYPLLPVLFDLMNRGYRARIQGKEIGEEIVSLTQKWKWETFTELSQKMTKYIEKQKQKLLPDNRMAFKSIEDKGKIVISLVEKCIQLKKKTKNDLHTFIRLIFKDEGDEIVLSTVHKYKGLEKKDVFIYGHDEFFPAKWARKDFEKEEEERIKFVAYSRAMERLFLVNFEQEERSIKFTGTLPQKGKGKNQSGFLDVSGNDSFDF